jgi:hypothetical protein
MPEFVVTVNRKIIKEFKVDAKNRWQAKNMVKNKVLDTSMDCRENYGDDISELPLIQSRDYISTVEPYAK